ncbi:hypothetical protein BGZ82_001693 [Podila clonocystis]|nr:hypothetical protein BGZ82_001693 [Podila clonocystis]
MSPKKITEISHALSHEDEWFGSTQNRSATAYILEFNIRDKQAAHGQYLKLIDRAIITEKEKKELRKAFLLVQVTKICFFNHR